VSQVFTIMGWAADFAADGGTGVDAVTVAATRLAGGAALALGSATYGQMRADVAAAYGSRFGPTGYSLRTSLAPGAYDLVITARSMVTGGPLATVRRRVTVRPSEVRSAINAPGNGATLASPFALSGWAVDSYAASGTGIQAIHAWAYPAAGGAPLFVGVATYGLSRTDVAQVLGSTQFTNCGFSLPSATLPSGTWTISLFALVDATQSFAGAGVVTITVP
jgi:hypothetical protein